MNTEKLKRAIYCLYALCGIKIAVSLYLLISFSDFKLLNGSKGFGLGDTLSYISFGDIFISVAFCVFTFFIVEALKQEKLWGWIAALTVFTIGFPSLAFPASLLGILSLVDKEVRNTFITQLDIKL